MKIALIECWFGPYPPWHDLYLRTCERNADVSWIVFSDQPIPRRVPSNVIFLTLTKNELAARASRALGVPIDLPTCIKVCELRPMFGLLFSDVLTGFTHWGYNDSDVFWGRIRHFVTDEILIKYDIITSCRTSICGQFTLFRNEGVMKEIFRLIPSYSSGFQTASLTYMDETGLDDAVKSTSLKVLRRQLQIHDVGSKIWEDKARELELNEKGHLDDWFWEGGACRWQNGVITHIGSGSESMFFHFKSWKTEWRRRGHQCGMIFSKEAMSGFEIREDGIHPIYIRKARVRGTLFKIRYRWPTRLFMLLATGKLFTRKKAAGVKRLVRKLFV